MSGKPDEPGTGFSLAGQTLSRLADGIRSRDFSATEVLQAHLDAIAEKNPGLNAIVTLDAGRAMEAAERLDRDRTALANAGPLAGVPVTIKDSFATAGLRTTCGLPALKDHVPEADATVVARLKAAGALVMGKTNLPPGCRGFQTDNTLFGRTVNPWDPACTPGGSTGGGACAVAAGMSPFDIGSDLGGSLRIPAHFCGLCTLMATNHRISRVGHIPELPGRPRGLRTMGVPGPVARCIDDLETVYGIIAGPDPHWPLVPPVPLGERLQISLPGLRLGWVDGFPELPVTPACRERIHQFLRHLEDAGADLMEGWPADFSIEENWDCFGFLRGAETASSIPEADREAALEALGMSPEADNPIDRAHYRGARTTMRGYTECLTRRDTLIRSLETFLATCDVLLCPVTSGTAFPHCPPGGMLELDGLTVSYALGGGIGFTSPFNLTGNPVVVLPLGLAPNGLPVGIQIIGRRWQERPLLAVARALETHIGETGFHAFR